MAEGEGLWSEVFDYHGLRLMVGLFAFLLPIVVWLIAGGNEQLSSISWGYYTAAREEFVAILSVVAAFLWAYNGHDRAQQLWSSVAGLSAALVAFFPTAETTCSKSVPITSWIHYGSALVLFVILAWFCFVPFRQRALSKNTVTGRRRAKIYFCCGTTMVLAGAGLLISYFAMECADRVRWGVTYWAEFAALWAFGIAWIVSGEALPLISDAEDRYNPLRSRLIATNQLRRGS